jgi:hypothetical protein
MAIVAGIVLLGAAVLLVRRADLTERTSTGGTGADSGPRAL